MLSGRSVSVSKRKHRVWNGQRILAIFLIVTAIIQIIGSITTIQWVIQVTQLIQVRHPYIDATARVAAGIVSMIWWVIVLLIGVYLFVDKNFWENRIFEGRKL